MKTSDSNESGVTFDFQPINIDYPGRFVHNTDEAVVGIKELAEFIIKEKFPDGNDSVPFVLFGHSMGSFVAFEVVRILKEKGMHLPLALFVSGRKAPFSQFANPSMNKLVSEMNFDEIVQHLKEQGSTYDFNRLLKYGELAQRWRQSMSLDYKCLEIYGRSFERIDCPLIAICGDQDPYASPSDAEEWKCHCNDYNLSLFQSYTLKGHGHFYLENKGATEEVSDIIFGSLKKVSSLSLNCCCVMI